MTDTKNSIYFSFFMFTADLRPQDSEYSKILIQHLNALDEMGYTGYDMHVANPSPNVNYAEELDNYRQLKDRFNQAGFSDASFNTNEDLHLLLIRHLPGKTSVVQRLNF